MVLYLKTQINNGLKAKQVRVCLYSQIFEGISYFELRGKSKL